MALVDRTRTNYSKRLTQEFLQKEYIDNGKSTRQIEKEFGIPRQCVGRALKRHNFEYRHAQPKDRHEDLTGRKFNMLTVLSYYDTNRHRNARWLCQCDCGNQVIVQGRDLVSGHTKSCGCLSKLTGFESHRNSYVGEVPGGVWSRILSGAKNRDIDVEITQQDASDQFIKQNRICPLTGIQLVLSWDRNICNASLDRIDSSIGYTKSNIQWIYKPINELKGSLSDEKLIELCSLVYNKTCAENSQIAYWGID